RTQQVIAYESGVVNSIDPLGGSYLIESLTSKIEEEAEEYFRKIEALGGVIPAIERGFFQREIADASFRYQQELDARLRVMVGVNDFTGGIEEDSLEILRIDRAKEEGQVARVQEVRARRDAGKWSRSMDALRKAAQSPNENLMTHLIEAVRAYATEGEIM